MIADGRSALSVGARRPGRFFLFVSTAVILAATLAPAKEWEGAKAHLLCVLCNTDSFADALGNTLLFVPFGVAMAAGGWSIRRTALFGAVLSFGIEVTQFVIPGRDPNLGDVLFNACGAALGSAFLRTNRGRTFEGALVRIVSVMGRPEPRVADRLALGAALFVVAILGLTGVLLQPVLPFGTYLVDSSALQSTVAPLRLGGSTYPKDYFRGLLDEVRIYNGPRSANEIRADMNRPFNIGTDHSLAVSPDLVAAYSFEDGKGRKVTDISGRGNTGDRAEPTWTGRGKFGGALAFDGVRDVVVVPHSTSLDVNNGLTLEAWVCPTSRQDGWGAVVQKEVDAYFLTASSDAGQLRPAGGGTFGGGVDSIKSPMPIPMNAWTHLAFTYDGATLRLYINGNEVASRTRWIYGQVLDASVGTLQLHPGRVAESADLRRQLLAGAPIQAHVVTGSSVPAPAPFLDLRDRNEHEFLFLGAQGDDLVLRLRSRAVAAGLNPVDSRFPQALGGAASNQLLAISVSPNRRGYCVDVNRRSSCGHGFTIGSGWAFFAYTPVLSSWVQELLSGVWMAALFFAPGFWARRGWGSCAAALIAAGGVFVLPWATGAAPTPMAQISGVLGGLLAGCAYRLKLRRTFQGAA